MPAEHAAPALGPAAPADPRHGPVYWPLPDQAASRRRARAISVVCALLAVWYLSWLLQGQRVGNPVLFGLLAAAEAFNLMQALGFWWTCARQRLRPPRPAVAGAVDVMIPVYDEPLGIVEPTIAAAVKMAGEDVRVWVLDDGGRAELEDLAARHGAGYMTRQERRGAKAGNLNRALEYTSAPFVVVLDCDHVPRPNFLQRTLGHLDDPEVAYVQTPQYYSNAASSPVAAAAAAQQALFFGPIARGKDGYGAMFCCGTNVVFRRSALEQAGGFPEASLTEDFELSVRLHERGWRSVYVAEVLACGLGPEDMSSYVSQQQRWARGCLSTIPAILRARLPWRQRVQYLLSASYFLSGWTLLVYMSLPLVRILFGVQPLAATSADQFLLHFAPYYGAALAAVALAGYGTYTFAAFALAATSFWIHIQATLNALLRRSARFVVTPKRGARVRQPKAVAPALAVVAALVGVAIYGLMRNRGAATLNNVAFAGLHSSVLLIGAIPALRVRASAPLLPEAQLEQRPPISWPRWLAVAALMAALLTPLAVGALGSRELAEAPTLSIKAHASADAFFASYVNPDGRVVRHDQGGDTVSEGQAYAMLLAVALNDRSRFDRVWRWTRSHLLQPDGLLAYRWSAGAIASGEAATDADLDAARALALASRLFSVRSYGRDGAALTKAVLDHETVPGAGGATVLVAGPWARRSPAVVNPSYFSPRAYADLFNAYHEPRWSALEASSRLLATTLTHAGRALPPDWAALEASAALGAQPIADPAAPLPGTQAGALRATSGLDAARLTIRAAESCVSADRRIAASLWPLYRRAPGAASHALDGSPASSQQHPTSLVAAAAAASAAGDHVVAAALLDRAQALDDAHPTYYGAAWVALGRVMLTSTALGACARG